MSISHSPKRKVRIRSWPVLSLDPEGPGVEGAGDSASAGVGVGMRCVRERSGRREEDGGSVEELLGVSSSEACIVRARVLFYRIFQSSGNAG